MTEQLRKLLVDTDSALSLIFHRKRSAIRELGEDFEREVEQLLTRLRRASEQIERETGMEDLRRIARELQVLVDTQLARLNGPSEQAKGGAR